MLTTRRLAKLLPALVLVALALPSSASAQATRTWVSGVGDDANPCSRTAPCKTFAGAISKTAPKGEINCLDPGGFGGVTITKSITIKCHYTEGGVLVSGTNAIVINAAATDKVTLKGLDVNGLGTGLNGVKVLSALRVNIVDSEIYEFTGAGININPTSAVTRVGIVNSHIHDTGIGVINAPGSNAITATVATLRNNDIHDNTCGVVSSSQGTNGSTPNAALDCGSNGAGSGINKTAFTGIYHNGVNDNATGVFSRGGSSTVEIAYNEITGSSGPGLKRLDGGHIKTFITPATNVISNNGPSDAPDQTAPLTKRAAKRIR
jgi:hypothetical protein